MILMHLYRDWNCELRAQLMVIGCFVWNWMWFCFYMIKISEADAFCESGSPNPSCLALATSLWSDPATILCQYDQDLQQSAPRSTTLLRSRPQVHGRRGNKQDSARPRAHQEQEGIGRRIEAEIASAAGEALAGGLLWQWLRAVRVGRVLWGARGLQQALRKWFQAQFHALLKFIALYFDYLDFVRVSWNCIQIFLNCCTFIRLWFISEMGSILQFKRLSSKISSNPIWMKTIFLH